MEGLALIGFDEPIVVDDTEDGAEIDGAVEQLPASAAEAADPSGGGGDGERDEEEEGGKADGDEAAFLDIVKHIVEIEEFIEPDIGGEVEAGVGESEEAEHAAETDEEGEAEEGAEWSDGEGEDEEAHGPIAGRVGDGLDGVGGELVMEAAPEEAGEGCEAEEKEGSLRPFT